MLKHCYKPKSSRHDPQEKQTAKQVLGGYFPRQCFWTFFHRCSKTFAFLISQMRLVKTTKKLQVNFKIESGIVVL